MMKFPITKVLRACGAAVLLMLAPAAGHAGADSTRYETQSFATTYTVDGTSNKISGVRSKVAGSYPVYVHIGGTDESYVSLWANAAI